MSVEMLIVVECFSQALFLAAALSALFLIPLAICGLFVGFLQALTSIQDQVLSFVPKVFFTTLILYLFVPWIQSVLIDFEESLLRVAVSLG